MGNNYHYNKHPKKKKSFIDESYVPPYDKELLSQSIDILKLSDAVKEKLLKGNVKTIRDVVVRCEKDFYRISTFDKRNLGELKSALNNKRLRLKPMPEAQKPEVKKEDNQPSKPIQNANSNNNQVKGQKGDNKPNKDNNHNQKKGEKRQNATNQPNGRGNDKQPQKQNKFDSKKIREEVSEQKSKEEREKLRPKKQEVVHPQDKYVKINKNGKWGFATRDGKTAIEPEYDEVFLFHEDLCCVEKNDKFGFINREGEIVIPIEYDCALSFSEGYACVFKGEHCGYIDAENNLVVNYQFDAGTPVIEGSARVKKLGKWGELFIDNPTEIRWII